VINVVFEKCVRAVAKEKGTVSSSKSTKQKKMRFDNIRKEKKFEVFLSLRNSERNLCFAVTLSRRDKF
jgi:hypothetical protein